MRASPEYTELLKKRIELLNRRTEVNLEIRQVEQALKAMRRKGTHKATKKPIPKFMQKIIREVR